MRKIISIECELGKKGPLFTVRDLRTDAGTTVPVCDRGSKKEAMQEVEELVKYLLRETEYAERLREASRGDG